MKTKYPIGTKCIILFQSGICTCIVVNQEIVGHFQDLEGWTSVKLTPYGNMYQRFLNSGNDLILDTKLARLLYIK